MSVLSNDMNLVTIVVWTVLCLHSLSPLSSLCWSGDGELQSCIFTPSQFFYQQCIQSLYTQCQAVFLL